MSVDRLPAESEPPFRPIVELATVPIHLEADFERLDEPGLAALLEGLLGAKGRGDLVGSLARAGVILAPVAVAWSAFHEPDELWWTVARRDGRITGGRVPGAPDVAATDGRRLGIVGLPDILGGEVSRLMPKGLPTVASEPFGSDGSVGAVLLADDGPIAEAHLAALRRIARLGTQALLRFRRHDASPVDEVGSAGGLLTAIDRLPAALLDYPEFVRLVEEEVERVLPGVSCQVQAPVNSAARAGRAVAAIEVAPRKSGDANGDGPAGWSIDLPIQIGRRTLGLLSVTGSGMVAPREASLRWLRSFCDRLGPFLDVALRHAAVTRDADTDGLTGLANHRAFYRVLTQELATRQPPVSLSILLFDIDGLKQLNDSQGHLAGDALLRQFARILEANVRRSDFVARYGGDEFAVVMPQLGADQAWLVGARIRRALGKRSLTSPLLRPAAVSFGVATAPADGIGATDLIAAADHRLYATRGYLPEGPQHDGHVQG